MRLAPILENKAILAEAPQGQIDFNGRIQGTESARTRADKPRNGRSEKDLMNSGKRLSQRPIFFNERNASDPPASGLRPTAGSITIKTMQPPIDFYQLQRRQKIRSLAVVFLLLLFYAALIGLFMLAGWLTIGLFGGRTNLFGSGFWLKFLAADGLFAGGIAAIHYFDTKKNGAAYLLKRLGAQTPARTDRYHLLFAESVEAIRLAAGLPHVEPLIFPTLAMNSLALIQPDGSPAVVVTEGLLAECSRDEIEAVIAHEIGHIARGDTFILTLVCGLSSFFERLRAILEPDVEASPGIPAGIRSGIIGSSGLLYLAAALGAAVIKLLGVFVSRERELLADAAAVEFGRSPEALARVLLKAQARNAFIGDFSLAFAPLFLIAPSAPGDDGGPAPRWSSSHPSFARRIGLLAEMVHKTPEEIAATVRAARQSRESARTIAEPAAPPPGLLPTGAELPKELGEWILLRPDSNSSGPFTLGELLFAPHFSPAARVKNTLEGLEGRAADFPQIRDALRRQRQARPADVDSLDRCPRCRIPLGDSFYEGVPIKICRRCSGKSVDRTDMNRLIARREIGFSESLVRKAEAFRDAQQLNPGGLISPKAQPDARLACPACGYRMTPRPFNYQYFVPVDKCLACGRIWFDADELEILQILIERTRTDESIP
jgi:Zn-dependent protease with chaperone function/Zn-finger nucleic acid-binding protein